MKPSVDYSLYLVTDSTEAILGSRDLVDVVGQALNGGVTIIQYRDKTSDTGALISNAKALHAACKRHSIPLLINDRVDVALAVDCEGVHIGQDDMSVASARQLLGPSKIIGATVSSIDEARVAVEQGADYLGIGTLYATSTKKNTKDIIGVNGIRKILRYLESSPNEAARAMKTVCIGGVNASNVQRVLYKLQHAPSSTSSNGTTQPKSIDGVALVSAIIGAHDPRAAAANLKTLVTSAPPFALSLPVPSASENNEWARPERLHAATVAATKAVHERNPLSHNMTNLVVQHLSASIALAIGASPIMSNAGAEAGDIAKLGGGLVVNMGTATEETLRNQLLATHAYNASPLLNPTLLDPVAAGATSTRFTALQTLLSSAYFSLIKGNESEICAVARASGLTVRAPSQGDGAGQQRGVDSASLYSTAERAGIVKALARRERCIVLMTGVMDVLSDGVRCVAVSNGCAYLGAITGSGCALGTVLSAYLAACRGAAKDGGGDGDLFLAALAGLLHYEIAAEKAAGREDVRGPGTFVPAFVDELYNLRMAVVNGEKRVLGRIMIEVVEVGDGEGIVTVE